MTVLVTGSNGFLGKNLVKRLKSLGIDTICISKPCSLDRFNQKNLDTIFHLGGPCSIIQFNKDPFDCVQNTINSFLTVLGLAQSTNAKLIYPSSGNIYGSQFIQNELSIPRPCNLYGRCKLWCEEMAQSFPNIDITILRIFAGYGPGEERKGELASVICHFLKNMMVNHQPIVWGDGEQRRDFIYVDDIVDGFLASMKTKERVVNLGSGISYSFNQVIEIINGVLGSHIEPKFVEKPKIYVDKTQANITLMNKMLGVQPISLKDGIRKFAKYLREKAA